MYSPDHWAIIKFPEAYKILAGWTGGFAAADEWRLSSGITHIEDGGNTWIIHNHSGSIYQCAKHSEKMSNYTYSIYEAIMDAVPTVEVVSIEEAYGL